MASDAFRTQTRAQIEQAIRQLSSAAPGGVSIYRDAEGRNVAPPPEAIAPYQRALSLLNQYGVNSTDQLPTSVQMTIPFVAPSDYSGNVLRDFFDPNLNRGLYLAAAGGAGMAAGGAGAAGGASGATAAEEAAMLTGAGVGGGGAAVAPVASGTGAAIADAPWGVNSIGGSAGGAGVSEFGTMGSTGATGPITGGTGGGMASSGFLGLSTSDWVNLGTSLGGAILQSNAAKAAAADQTAASNAAIAESRRQYDTTRSDLMPWLQQGTAAVGRLGDLLGTSGKSLTPEQIMAMDPGYQFRLGEGNKAISNLAGSRGMTNSGATLKALTRFGQDYASNEYGNIYNRLAGVAGTGQQAGTTIGGFGAQNANTIGGYMTGAANARGAAGIGAANAYGGALSNIGNYYSQNQMLDKILKERTGTSGVRLYGGY